MPVLLGAILLVEALLAALLVYSVPMKEGARDWVGSLDPGGWMAWTFPTAAVLSGHPDADHADGRVGVYLAGWQSARRHPALRDDAGRPSVLSLLGSAFIHLAWLGLIGPNLWWALALSIVYAVGVFRYV
jgi:predicted small integral membrane protein